MTASPPNPATDQRGRDRPLGVLLMSFGTAETLDDVPAYLASVRGGKPAPDELVSEFQRRFARVGGSPLTRITREQAAALEAHLGKGYVVRVGMRHAPPLIADGLRDLVAAGAERAVAIILSPQYSDVIMGGYLRAAAQAQEALAGQLRVSVAGAWHEEESFVAGLARRLRATLESLDPEDRERAPVLFTAHSLPRSVADGEPEYIGQLHATARAVADRTGLPEARWIFAYQSAGHTREEWLTPDIKDLLPGLRDTGQRTVVIAPVQFLADHLEVLYDIDVAAREEAEALGMKLVRTEMLNCDPALIQALTSVVRAAV